MLKKLTIVLLIMFNLNCFSQQFKLLGSAFQTNPTTYTLTTNTNNQSGMITNLYPLDLTKNFSLSFQINLGSNDGWGADGIAFMLSRNCNPSLTGGQGLGVSGTNNSIVVEFDTWDNGSFVNDISNDHIAIYRDAIFDAANNIMDGTSTPVCMASNCANTEDDQWHNVRIEWEFINSTSQKILVFFNNNLRAVSTGNHITNRFLGQSVVFYSISASTGGATNLQQVRFESNNNPTYCGGQSITLKAPPLGSSYSWSSGINSTLDSAIALADFSKVITCSYIDFCNTFQTVNFDITVNTSIFNPSSAQNVCLNKKPFAFSVSTNASDTNFISFVYFNQKKTDSNVYNGGTFLGNASPFNGFAAYDPPILGNSGSLPNIPGTYFVYAIASPKPANPNCRPFEEIIVNVLPHKDTFFNTSICIGQSFKGRTTSGTYNDTIFNGAFNGCDSIISFNLTVNDTTKKDSFFTTCKNQPIIFNGINRNVTGIYRDTLVNSKGCDSFVYLHLTVNDTTKKDSFLTICKNQPIIFNGISRNLTGIYRDTLVNSKGCDSFMYLHLTVNDTTKKDSFLTLCRPQFVIFNGISRSVTGVYRDTLINSKGCDSFVYLHLTVNDTTKKDSFFTTCRNQPIVFNGISRNVTGIYRDTLLNSKGCDSFVYLHLTVNDTTKKDSFFTTCRNQPIVFNGISRNVTGIYRDTLVNSKGCDSFVYLHLTVNDTTKKDSFLTICKNQPILFNGISRNVTGIYRDTLVNSKGCDSFLYLHLTVNDTTKKDSFLTLCTSQSVIFNSISRNVTGIYRDTLINSKGCDSFVYLHLTVNDTTKKDSFFTTCKNQPIVFNGISRNVTGIYRDTLVNSKGCDSFLYLHLTVNDTTKKDSFLITCKNQPIVFNGISRNVSGIYRDTLVNSKGCDSFAYLHLTVNDTTKKDSFLSICSNQSVLFNGNFLNTAGIYRDTLANSKGCDSFVYLHLTVNLSTNSFIKQTICEGDSFLGYSKTGTYVDTLIGANRFGCDSVRTLELIIRTRALVEFKTICENESYNGYTQTGVYKDTIIDNFGCTRFRTLNLTVANNGKIIENVTICYNDFYKGYKNEGIYFDTFISENGCTQINELRLSVRNKPLKPINDVSICEGVSGSINADQGMILYTWQDGSTKPSLEVNSPGIYYLVVMDSFKCVDFDTIIVNQLPNPDIKININSNDVFVNEEVDIEAIILDASSLGSLNWKSLNLINCDTCLKTKIKVDKSAWLYLNFTNQNQCKLADSIFIDILSSNQNILEFPDAFSPNKDLLNDSYGPDYKNIKEINWQIFNRWGEKVFESNSPSYRWDGYYKSELQISNYFVLICEAIFNDGSKKRISKRLLLAK
jgi:gliding motility-associated-like protein